MSVNRLFNLVFLFVIVLSLGLPAHARSVKTVSHVPLLSKCSPSPCGSPSRIPKGH